MIDYVERSREALQLMDAAASYFPFLMRTAPDGSSRFVPYRFGRLCLAQDRSAPYSWIAGRRLPTHKHLVQLVYEILAVAEKERAELQQLRGQGKQRDLEVTG